MNNIQTDSKRIIKINDCSSLSKASTLTYHIGCDDKQSVYFRIHANTGGGFFNAEWIALSDIQKAFDSWPVDNPITSFALNNLFTGKSANSPAFLMAILKEEGIIATLKGKHRTHEYIEPTEFLEVMSKLISDEVHLNVEVATNISTENSTKGNASETKKRSSRSKPQPKSA